jgi:serine/threonine-protein kinase
MNSSWSRKFPRLAAETETSNSSKQLPEEESEPYLAGEVIGDRYRLVRELGSGGMGVVWVAHSLVLGVDVALKLIRANRASPGLGSRMAREAHAAARLGHPALVRVFDFGWTNRGDPFLVMELVQGETLSSLLSRDGRIAAIRAVQMLLPVADGLRLAHDKNIVHRDIKPDNIFLATDALGRVQPKLLDFGIAKVGQAAYDGKLTQVGTVLGSPEYMSPEQATGEEDVDERTDVWSLCVVLYEMVTGTVPFRKGNYNALMQAIINDAPIPLVDYKAGDSGLWMVVERGLKKERNQRWANMTELGEALALWLYEHGVKEDLSGNSIRAVWLDGVLSGLRADVPLSEAPENSGTALASIIRGRHQATARPVLAAGAGLANAVAGHVSVLRRRWKLAVSVFAGVVLGLVALGIAVSSGPDNPARGDEDRAVVPKTTPRAEAPPKVAPAPARPEPVVVNRQPSVVEVPSPHAADAGAVAEPKPRPSSTPVVRRPRSTSKEVKAIRDFGF